MKTQQKYDAAFDLLQHCLRIRPNAPSALFELSQFYMALKQEEQAVISLEKQCITLQIIIGMHKD